MRYVFDTMIIIYTVVQLFDITVQIIIQIILPCLTLLRFCKSMFITKYTISKVVSQISKLISGYTVMKLDQQR